MMVIVLEVIYLNIIISIWMGNLNIMYKLKLDRTNAVSVKKMKNKNLLKLNVVIMYVQNVLKNLQRKEILNVHIVKKKIMSLYLMINNFSNLKIK